ncbi:MAG: NAD(P)H-hydrate dehydratase [Clostridiales bacterium]|nr:NAD(P)H-hydrate dehydratase [Clostridiales bacterium]
MLYALNAGTARVAEERAAAELGIEVAILMDRAGTALAREVARRAPDGPIAVVAGKGNNGGDGWVAARRLASAGRDVTVFTPVDPAAIRGPAGEAARAAAGAGVVTRVVILEGSPAPDALRGHALVIDALFGTGFLGPVRPPFVAWIDAIGASGAVVVAADVPSGVDASTGTVLGCAVRADVTVAFSAPKTGTLVYPGAEYAGEVVVADIGIPQEYLGQPGDLELWDPIDYRALLPRPAFDSHKNSRGRVLIVAGSGAFPGAAALTAMGAQRMGAGYVAVAAPESIVPVLQAMLTSAVVMGLPESRTRTLASKVIDAVLDVAREFDAVVLGPGMTVAHGAVHVVRALTESLDVPLVIDADGLNALIDTVGAITVREAPTIITPHPGELARLLGVTPQTVQSDRLMYGGVLSGPRLTCVLKGARTVVSGCGRQVITVAGGPALATAGTGDVLAGIAGSLLAQGLEPLEAGALAAYLHARAGDLAAAELTALSVVAEDIPAYLPRAIRELDEEA